MNLIVFLVQVFIFHSTNNIGHIPKSSLAATGGGQVMLQAMAKRFRGELERWW